MTQTQYTTHATFNVVQFRFASRLNFVVFPIDQGELAESLKKVGYQITIPQQPSSSLLTGMIRIRLAPTGEIARKGDLLVDMDPDKQILGVLGKGIAEVTQAYNEVEKLIESELKADIRNNVRFYEIIGTFEIETGKSPIDKIARISTMGEFIKSLSSVLGMNVSPFSVRIFLEGAVPNNEEWFEMTVEPLVPKATTTYFVNAIYRHPQKEKTLNMAQTMATKVNEVINVIESQS